MTKQHKEEDAQSENWFDDEEFQDRLVAILVADATALKSVADLLDPDDFRPLRGMKNGRSRWVVAERALEHYKKHREPLGGLLRADVLEHAGSIGFGASQLGDLRRYVGHLSNMRVTAPDAIVEKITRYKLQRRKAAAIQELVELQASNQLTDDRWRELMSSALLDGVNGNGMNLTAYMEGVDARVERRRLEARHARSPLTFIDPLDMMLRVTVMPQQLGLVMAPYKRGKSLFLAWLDVAYAIQRMDVMHFTLEDAKRLVEDRLDAIITHIPSSRLGDFPKHTVKRFKRFRAAVSSHLDIVDATSGNVSVAKIEQAVLAAREHGRRVGVLIVDYDQKIVPPKHYRERRDEYDAIYVELQQLASRHNMIVWTAAQTQRDTRHLKILSGDRVAEDINKVRNVTCALSLGKGDWTDDSIYVWVAAHKQDRMECGCEIVPALERSLIYDRERTRIAARENQPEEEGDA